MDPEVYKTLGRLEAKLDAVLILVEKQEVFAEKLELRLSSLENFKAKALATIAAVAATAGGSLGMSLRNLVGGG